MNNQMINMERQSENTHNKLPIYRMDLNKNRDNMKIQHNKRLSQKNKRNIIKVNGNKKIKIRNNQLKIVQLQVSKFIKNLFQI